MQADANERSKTFNMNSGAESGQKAETVWWSPFSEISRKTEIKNLKNRERKKIQNYFLRT